MKFEEILDDYTLKSFKSKRDTICCSSFIDELLFSKDILKSISYLQEAKKFADINGYTVELDMNYDCPELVFHKKSV